MARIKLNDLIKKSADVATEVTRTALVTGAAVAAVGVAADVEPDDAELEVGAHADVELSQLSFTIRG